MSSRLIVKVVGLSCAGLLASAMGAGSAWSAGDDELRAELAALRRRVVDLEARVASGGDRARDVPQLTLGGQYRVNSYSSRNDDGNRRQTASRVRIRQNLDLDFDERLRTHLQLELGHTNDNITTTPSSSRANSIAVRHAVIDYAFDNGMRVQTGIVPLSDRFRDTLFSGDWDYNPVAVALTAPLSGGTLRAFAGNLAEGNETWTDDDLAHYQLDFELPLPGESHINLGASFARVADPAGENRLHANFGVGASFPVKDGVVLRGFLLGSRTDRSLLGTIDNADGIAGKLELILSNGLGLMATHASGDSDGTGFLPMMALATTNGYWGYTGILTVQGPTDTGFDGDSVNISNNGFGLTTVQARFARPLNDDFDIHLAAGWFGNSDTPGSRQSRVGLDLLAMGTYHFNRVLGLDFGVAYARLEDGVSGYSNGVIGGATFNQPAGRERDKLAFFTRLQAEF